MNITKIGHSCVSVHSGETKVLVDPGSFTDIKRLRDVSDISAVFITHNHPDHITKDRLEMLIAQNENLTLYGNEQVKNAVHDWGFEIDLVADGQSFEHGDISVEAWEVDHHPIHNDITPVKNTAFLFNDAFLHPGDALFVPDRQIKAVALPFAPFCTIGESVDYGIALKPGMIIPVHDGFINPPGPYESIPRMLWEKYGIDFNWVNDGESITI